MAQQAEIKRVDGSRIKVSGRLDVTTVAWCKRAGVHLIDEVESAELDLADAQVVGSAAVALLIAWQRHAVNVGKQIRFINPPANLFDIARACGVDTILNIAWAGDSA